MKLVECVPNFSEGVRKEVVDEIAKSIASCGVEIFDVEMNPVHNRSVITFVGSIDKVFEAAFQGAKTAVKLIDLNKHKGEHPRMGACDVVPIVPMNASTEDCKELAERIGERIAKELEVPVYFYEENARISERKKLEKIRKGGFEWLRENVEQRMPDIGEKMHPTAGATVVGARKPLVAYNVYLNRKDEQMGKSIAKAIRESGGGLKNVKAIGFVDGERTQISMNLVDFNRTPIYRVFELLKAEAERYGCDIEESEVVGLMPEKALIDSAIYYLRVNSFKEEQLLENRLEEIKLFEFSKIGDFLEALSSKDPTPGGGTASAIVGAFSCSLAEKVCGLSKGELDVEAGKLEKIRSELFALSQADTEAFNEVMAAYKTSRDHPERRKEAIQNGLKNATLVPLKTMERCKDALEIGKRVLEKGNKNAISDAKCAMELAKSAMKGASYNVDINLESIKDEDFKKDIISRVEELMRDVR